jgi:hypothetical protein
MRRKGYMSESEVAVRAGCIVVGVAVAYCGLGLALWKRDISWALLAVGGGAVVLLGLIL